jgi:hypothetical protein
MPKEGQVWPLQLVCLLLLVLGLLTFIDPTLFGQKAPITRETSLLLLGGAVLTGIVLYSPLLSEIFKAGGVGGAITLRIGDPANPTEAPNSVIGRLQSVQTRANAIADANAAAANNILGRLQAAQGQMTTLATICETISGPNPAHPPPTSIIGRLEIIRAQMAALAAVGAAIGTSDDPAQTIQKCLGEIQTRLGALEATLKTGLKDLNEKLDSLAAKPRGGAGV